MTHFIPGFRVDSRRAVLLSLPLLAIFVAACGASSSPAASSAASPMTVSATQTSLGSVLSGPSGDTVYVLLSAQGMPIPCTGQCLSAWPPVAATAGGSTHSGSGVTATLAVEASVMQITADGAPLYYFSGDSAAGQVNGQAIKSFGGIWYAVQTSGTPLTSASAASAGTPNAASGPVATPTSSGSGYGY